MFTISRGLTNSFLCFINIIILCLDLRARENLAGYGTKPIL